MPLQIAKFGSRILLRAGKYTWEGSLVIQGGMQIVGESNNLGVVLEGSVVLMPSRGVMEREGTFEHVCYFTCVFRLDGCQVTFLSDKVTINVQGGQWNFKGCALLPCSRAVTEASSFLQLQHAGA